MSVVWLLEVIGWFCFLFRDKRVFYAAVAICVQFQE